MEWASKESLSLLYFLLPGLVAAWVFYGLTAHPKKEAFERVVQALIFTAIVQAITTSVKFGLIAVGQYFIVGEWTSEAALIWSVAIAFAVGVIFSALANSNWMHIFLTKCRVTKRTSYPSEWYSAFHRFQKFCVLHLKDGRRLRGWPEEWPDQCDRGHFLMQHPEWVLDTGERIPLCQSSRMLIAAVDVDRVEIEYDVEEQTLTVTEIAESQKNLLELHKSKEMDDGKRETNGRLSGAIAERPAASAELANTCDSGE